MTQQAVSVFIPDEQGTLALGKQLGALFKGAGVIFLDGNLGAGKTTLCKGVLNGLGYSGAVKSPTYTLVEPYTLDDITVYHFDLYRLGHPEELEYMGIRDYFDSASLCVIEWFEKGGTLLPEPDITVTITPKNTGRNFVLQAHSKIGKRIVSQLTFHEHTYE